MSSPNDWEILLTQAFKQLDAGNVPGNEWTLGGGTVLMFHFAHRLSKDIDIFFTNKQRLAAVSPRVNDGVVDFLRDYIEQDGFCKLYFPAGKIDFIYSRKVSEHTPQPRMLAGRMVQCDDPVEIVTKKVFWRNDRVTPRDIFDLAVVYDACQQRLVDTLVKYSDKVAAWSEQFQSEAALGLYEKWAATAPILSSGKPFLDRAFRLVSALTETVRLQAGTKEQKHEDPGRNMQTDGQQHTESGRKQSYRKARMR